MKKVISFLFKPWWKPLVCFAITFLLFFINPFIPYETTLNITLLLFFLGLLLIFISIIVLLVNKKWKHAFINFIAFMLGIFFIPILNIYVFFYLQNMPDNYANNLEIPKNIEIEKPQNENFSPTLKDTVYTFDKRICDFNIHNGMQPGIYSYNVLLGNIEKGTIYLKAYEITHNDPLSTESLRQRSSIVVENHSNSLKNFYITDYFTIYEGDWGYPYAARFEVWFKPENGKERKLTEKNYIIEGWQR